MLVIFEKIKRGISGEYVVSQVVGMVGWELQCSGDSYIKCLCVLYHLFISIWKKDGISLLHEANHGSIHSEGRNNPYLK